MTMTTKNYLLRNSENRAQAIVNRIIKTEKQLADARLTLDACIQQVDRLEKRLKRQNAKLRRENKIYQIIANDVDGEDEIIVTADADYDEFYLLANEMTA